MFKHQFSELLSGLLDVAKILIFYIRGILRICPVRTALAALYVMILKHTQIWSGMVYLYLETFDQFWQI